MHILGQKEAICNTVFSIFERRRGPPNVAGSRKTFPLPLSTGLAIVKDVHSHISTRKQPPPELAPAPLIYVFESYCACIVVCVDKLRVNTKSDKTVKKSPSLVFLLPPTFFQEASCSLLPMERMCLSTVGRNGGNKQKNTQQVTQHSTFCPKTA